MTIVIAYHSLTHIAVFADCRVSYDCTGAVADDNLQKIYQIGDKMILGFAGPLLGAHQVISAVRDNLKTYPKRGRPTAENLVRDVERWIRHEYQEIKQPKARENLSFVLAAVEPSREARSKCFSSDGTEIPKPKWIPSGPELRTLALKPHQSKPDKLYEEEKRGGCKIVGVQDNVVCNAIQRTLDENFSRLFKQPLWIQARVAVDRVMITLMKSGIRKVGGLLQCAMLGAWGIRWFPYESPSEYGDVALRVSDDRFVQQDNVTGEMIPLLSIWDWWEKWQITHPPGSSGIFEDPGLRKAVERLKNQR